MGATDQSHYNSFSVIRDSIITAFQCMCIDIVEIWFGIANGQISSIFDEVICPQHIHIFCFRTVASKSHQIYTKLDMNIDIVEIWFGIAVGLHFINF